MVLADFVGLDGPGVDRVAIRDCDPSRLERLGHFALKVYVEHAVHMARAGNMDMVGKGEAALSLLLFTPAH